MRLPMRRCVSTAIVGCPKATLFNTTLAVFLPTPARFQRLARFRHLASVFFKKLCAHRNHVLRLGAIKSDALNGWRQPCFAQFQNTQARSALGNNLSVARFTLLSV